MAFEFGTLEAKELKQLNYFLISLERQIMTVIRQGDVALTPLAKLPDGCTEIAPDGNRIVLAYGDVTGHAHAIYDHLPIADVSVFEIADASIARAKAKARLVVAPNGNRYLEVFETVNLKHEEHTAHALVPGGVTEAEKLLVKAHADKWIANAMRTDPVNHDVLTAAIKKLYLISGLKEPVVVIVPSPIVMAFAGGFSAAILHSKKTGFISTRDATDSATRDATRDATSDMTDSATYAATRDATYAATYAATSAATYAATRNTTRDVTYAATYTATSAATDSATYAATDSATSAATYAATSDMTDYATDAATRDATYAATLPAKMALLAKKIGLDFGVSNSFMLRCAQDWWRPYQGGNMWSSWPAFLSAFRDVLGLQLLEYDKFAAWEQCAIEGGFRFMHEDFCMVSDRPKTLLVDAENRPHCDRGPSHEWRDGWKLWHWHGVSIPEAKKHIIESPELITWQEIEAEENAEIRRVMISRYGAEKYVVNSGAKVVQNLPIDHKIVGLRDAKLLVKLVPGDEPIVYVDLLNSTPEPDGTVKRYMLRVDPNAYGGMASKDCHAAAASTWRNADGSLTFKDYKDYNCVAES
jgi:hypothetical protein